MYTLAPDVLGLRGRHVHVQVADIGLLWVRLQTLSDPGGLGARQERIGDEDESYNNTQRYSAGSWDRK